jgi:hypothetical protein
MARGTEGRTFWMLRVSTICLIVSAMTSGFHSAVMSSWSSLQGGRLRGKLVSQYSRRQSDLASKRARVARVAKEDDAALRDTKDLIRLGELTGPLRAEAVGVAWR